MAVKLGELSLFLTADDKALSKALVRTEKNIQKLSDKMTKFGRTLTLGVSLPLIAVGGAALKVAADFEQTEIAMRTMIGSTKESIKLLEELEKFAKATPFQFPDLLMATRRLIAFGFSAKQVIPALTIIGDSAAAFGLGSQEIGRASCWVNLFI